jgi:hypothetical protein
MAADSVDSRRRRCAREPQLRRQVVAREHRLAKHRVSSVALRHQAKTIQRHFRSRIGEQRDGGRDIGDVGKRGAQPWPDMGPHTGGRLHRRAPEDADIGNLGLREDRRVSHDDGRDLGLVSPKRRDDGARRALGSADGIGERATHDWRRILQP